MESAARTVDEGFGERLRRLREEAGLSQHELAERVAEHGGTMHQTTIARTEAGSRRVRLDEFLILAAALNVPPVLLLVPLGDADEVALTPRTTVHPHLALDWICGDEPLTDSGRYVIRPGEWRERSQRIMLHRELRTAQRETQDAYHRSGHADFLGVDPAEARADYFDALRHHHNVLTAMLKAGMRPPAVSPRFYDHMVRLGLDMDGLRRYERQPTDPPESDELQHDPFGSEV